MTTSDTVIFCGHYGPDGKCGAEATVRIVHGSKQEARCEKHRKAAEQCRPGCRVVPLNGDADVTTGGESICRLMHPLFQAGQGGSSPTSPLELRFHTCAVSTARRLNRLWHSVLPKTVESNLTRTRRNAYFAAECDGTFYAAAIWTDPIAYGLPADWLELRRFAIAPDAPKYTASRMLGWMVRQLRKKFPDVVKLISYQDCDRHAGTIYKAAGWKMGVKSYEHRNRGLRSGRKRNMQQTTATKQRWELDL